MFLWYIEFNSTHVTNSYIPVDTNYWDDLVLG